MKQIANQDNLKKLCGLIIFLSALSLFSIKSYYLIDHHRYLAYGFDSLRVYGSARQLIELGEVDRLSAHRIGLPFFIKISSEFFRTDFANLLTPAIWFQTIVPIFAVTALAVVIFRDFLKASVSALVLAIFYFPTPINYSNFTTLAVIPARVFFLISLLKTRNRSLQVISLVFFTLTVIATTSIYPLYGLLFDLFTVSYLFTVKSKATKKILITAISIQVVVLTGFISFAQKSYQHSLPIIKILERTYTFVQTNTSNQLGLMIFLSIVISQLIAVLLLHTNKVFLLKKTLKPFTKISFLFPIIGRILQLIALCLIFTELLQIAHPFSGKIIFLTPAIAVSQSYKALILLVVGQLFRENWSKFPRLALPFITFIAGYFILVIAYQTIPISKHVLNIRFIILFFVLLTTMVPVLLNPKNTTMFYMSCLLMCLGFSASFIRLQTAPYRGGNLALIEAMAWFSEQPDSLETLYLSKYYLHPDIPVQERPYGKYLVGSKLHDDAQHIYGKCDYQKMTCRQQLETALKEKQFKYIVIEDTLLPEDVVSYLTGLGQTIYETNGIIIIRNKV